MNIADLRKSYEKAELNENASHANPLAQFEQWLQEAIASEVPEPNAMTLATVASNLRPSTRVVLIKGCDARGIVWYTNYDSQKGQELAGNPFAALQFHWVELERVVRIEGRVEKVSDKESDAYFHSRPLDSRIGAWASPQSQVIDGRAVLVTNAAKYAAQFMLQPPRPRTGAATAWCPTNGSFGKAAKAVCMTGCVTHPQAINGCASGWRPERIRRTSLRRQCAWLSWWDQAGNKGSKAMAREMPNRAINVEMATAAVTVSSSLW
jgi:pyridoxamine 5'-phosphate oxidase